VAIPASIKEISHSAFAGCSNMASLTLPAGLTTIGYAAFSDCAKLTSVSFPASVHTTGFHAFYNCEITEATLPPGLASMGNALFASCPITKVTFLGNAPPIPVDPSLFAKSTTVYYYEGRTGFTSPTWAGYPTVKLPQPGTAPTWLGFQGLPPDADWESPPAGSGSTVPLITSYALNLDPHRKPESQLPRPQIVGNELRLSYYAGRSDVNYIIETSSDLKQWTSSGVIIGSPDANQIRTARITRTGRGAFLRIRTLRK
jgi:hypothetical protein